MTTRRRKKKIGPVEVGSEIAVQYKKLAEEKYTGNLVFKAYLNCGGLVSLRMEIDPERLTGKDLLEGIKKARR